MAAPSRPGTIRLFQARLVALTEPTTSTAMLRVLALMAEADGSVDPEEQQMMQRICDVHFQGYGSTDWQDATTSALDLKQAAKAIPERERPLTLKLAYMLISACGKERGFPINPAELYAFNSLVNHLEMTEDQRELAIAAAKKELRSSSDLWGMLRTQLSHHFGNRKNVLKSTP